MVAAKMQGGVSELHLGGRVRDIDRIMTKPKWTSADSAPEEDA